MASQNSPHARISATTITTKGGAKYTIYALPTFCPRCRRNSIPKILGEAAVSVYEDGPIEYTISLPLVCGVCDLAFIGEYVGDQTMMIDTDDNGLEFVGTIPSAEPKTIVSDALAEISPQFARVYDEAAAAQAAGLEELSGAGYRRALEFLVKDYLIHRDPARKNDFIGMSLGTCIRDHIKMPEIEAIAKEAVSIGNDFVHFKKYTRREVNDLRELIQLVWRWIDLNEEVRVANARLKKPIDPVDKDRS